MLDNYLRLGNEKAEIRYVEGEQQLAGETFDALAEALSAITCYFELSKPFPKVRAVLVPSRNEFDRLVRDLLRVEIEVPSNPARVAQPQRTDMVLLSPSAYESHSIFKYVLEDFRRLVAHELVHVVEEHLAPNIEATPRWWSEGLAVYISAQWRHENDFRRPVLKGVEENRVPRIAQIQTDRRLGYDWGWTIVRFINNTYGKEMILRIAKECPDGDVFSVIGEEASGLENRWRDWLVGDGRLTSQSSGPASPAADFPR